MPASCIRVLVQVPPTQFWLTANVHGKAAKVRPSAWTLAPHVRDPEGALCLVWPEPASAVGAIWGAIFLLEPFF